MTLSAVLLVALTALAPQARETQPAPPPDASRQARPVETAPDAVRRLAAERSRALVRKDLAALDRILAPGFVYTNASGEVLDREAYLARYVRDPAVKWLSQELEDVRVRVFGGTAVLTCRVRDRAELGGHSLDASFRSTYVYVQGETGWRCAAGHTGPAAQ
jgi:ketosteroid isomerase-like protein